MRNAKNLFFILAVTILSFLALVIFLKITIAIFWSLVIGYLIFGIIVLYSGFISRDTFFTYSEYLIVSLFILWLFSFLCREAFLADLRWSIFATALLFSTGIFMNAMTRAGHVVSEEDDYYY